MTGRVMAVDPGEKRIGVALSDETQTLAKGLKVISHVSLKQDCAEIARLATENNAVEIIVGSAVGEEYEETPASRHAKRVADALAQICGLPVRLWDESGSTQQARAIRLQGGARRNKRAGHLDEVAAAVILQSWLDVNQDIKD